MKAKYWTATVSTVGGKTILTTTGLPFTNLREARREKRRMKSSNAAVVKAGKDEMPTVEIVA